MQNNWNTNNSNKYINNKFKIYQLNQKNNNNKVIKIHYN